jgi:hypothetical protein
MTNRPLVWGLSFCSNSSASEVLPGLGGLLLSLPCGRWPLAHLAHSQRRQRCLRRPAQPSRQGVVRWFVGGFHRRDICPCAYMVLAPGLYQRRRPEIARYLVPSLLTANPLLLICRPWSRAVIRAMENLANAFRTGLHHRIEHSYIHVHERSLHLTVRKRGGRKQALGTSEPMAIPQARNLRWSLDFVADTPVSGRRFRILRRARRAIPSAFANLVARIQPSLDPLAWLLRCRCHRFLGTLWSRSISM